MTFTQAVLAQCLLKTGQQNSACPASIHSRLMEVYGPDVMLTQMVRRWCQQFRDGRTSVLHHARSHTAAAKVIHIHTFSWEHQDHAPYSFDVAPSDFHFEEDTGRAPFHYQ
jgi:hypothetical protein